MNRTAFSNKINLQSILSSEKNSEGYLHDKILKASINMDTQTCVCKIHIKMMNMIYLQDERKGI